MIETTALKDKISEFLASIASVVPAERLDSVRSEIEKLAQSGITKHAAQVGATAPEFTLPDPRGASVTLSKLLQRGPVVLTFYRGGWCPFCDLQLRAYQRALDEIHARGAELVAVSPQTPDYSRADVDKMALAFPVVSDAGNRVARAYGLVFKLSAVMQELQVGFGNPVPKFNGDESWELPMPGTFVIDRRGTIVLSHVDPNYLTRLEPAAILDALRKLSS